MTYFKIGFTIPESLRDLLLAELIEAGFTGFEEAETLLIGYVPTDSFDEQSITSLAHKYGLTYEKEEIAEQNWNAVWEENFQPVIIDGFCTVRADFHQIAVQTPYEIVITPKMSFGTGHHATTRLMIIEMSRTPFAGKNVLDFGTGTGILAILAEMLGAKSITAIDNDEWAYENARENIQRNNSSKIAMHIGSIQIVNGQYDVILANINRNILIENLLQIETMLNINGMVIMSGLMAADKKMFLDFVKENTSLLQINVAEMDNWFSVTYQKV